MFTPPPAPPTSSVSTVEFTLFPKLVPELRHKFWKQELDQKPPIVPWRVSSPFASSFLHPYWQPISQTSREARQQSLTYLKNFELMDQHERYEALKGPLPWNGEIYMDFSNDILMLQGSGSIVYHPEMLQLRAFESAKAEYELRNRASGNVVVPFDYHYGAEDEWCDSYGQDSRGVQDENGEWIGGVHQNPDNLTNLQAWARAEMSTFLESIIIVLPEKGLAVYLVVPEKGASFETHYNIDAIFYPRVGERELLHWTAAREGELIYTRKELRALDDGVTYSLRGYDTTRATPEVRLVVADYHERQMGRDRQGLRWS